MPLIKVAHVTTVDLSLRYLLLNQLLSIQREGYQVVGISSPGAETVIIEAEGIHHIPVPMTRNLTPLADLVSLWRLYRVMRQERFTIVHTHTPKAGLLGRLAAHLANVPIVVHTVHGFYFHEHMSPAGRRFYTAIERTAARCSDLILSQNQEDVCMAIEERICLPEKIKYLGNGIDLQRFDPARLSPEDLENQRARLGLPATTPVVGFVGRLAQAKGLLELFSAVRIVQEQVPNVRLLVVGAADFPKRDAVTPDRAREYGIADSCIFTGRRQDMPDLYALMDLLVLPSYGREGIPRVLMEASAMKVPCVATDVRGCREAVEHGRNGLLVALGDVQALAEAIIDLLTDRQKAQRLGEEGRRIARERFDERRVFETIKAEYARLLSEKGLPALRPPCA